MMDSLRAFDDDVGYGVETDEEPSMEAPPDIGFDERRMHVRAYNYWVSLLGGRAYPTIQDLDPSSIDDFGPQSVLLDFTKSNDNPTIAFLGRELREQCDLGLDIRSISQVPGRSLLSRLTDHYLQIIANCAPIGFEAEFVSMKGLNTMYRGILMPLSSDGDSIDFIYGVINWKELADNATTARINQQVDQAIANPTHLESSPVWADGPNAVPADEPLEFPALDTRPTQRADEDWLPGIVLDADAALADRLSAARETAEVLKSADTRSRAALYRALGQAYDFALAAERSPADYAQILDDAGVTYQKRAPMTPVAKLIFGVDYDKTRLTEFAAALSYGHRQQLSAGAMAQFLEDFDGGIKGVVAAERRQRRPDRTVDRAEQARTRLRLATPLAHLDIAVEGGEFVLLVARRERDGRLAVVAPVAADATLLERAMRKSA